MPQIVLKFPSISPEQRFHIAQAAFLQLLLQYIYSLSDAARSTRGGSFADSMESRAMKFRIGRNQSELFTSELQQVADVLSSLAAAAR